jgi:hypothetical protein
MATDANDGFEVYFAEKLWDMIPATYRHEDGLASPPGALRGLVETIARQAAVLRRSHDRLWEDQYAETADDWAVPYLADLVGTRLVSALNARGRRVDVAKTIYYRRRKGTPRVLEELVGDITGWEGVLVESFRRLGRAWHGLDPPPAGRGGRHSGTPPGGWADLRVPHAAELADGPFGEFHHTPDVRQHRGALGRYGIPKLAFHLYRLRALEVEGVTPRARAGGDTFWFDPSGRDVPLFAPRARPLGFDFDAWTPPQEWEVPVPIRCRLLGHAAYEVPLALAQTLEDDGLPAAAADSLRALAGVRFASERRLRTMLETLPSADLLTPPGATATYHAILDGARVPDCGKSRLLPDAVRVETPPGTPVPVAATVAGGLAGWTAPAPADKRLVIDPERGRFFFPIGPPADPVEVAYVYGMPGEIGAGTYDRRHVEAGTPDLEHTGGGPLVAADVLNAGVVQIGDSATYGPVANKASVSALAVQAANGTRPYLRLAGNWVLNTGANEDAEATLDGLWIGSDGGALILRGDYETVTLRHVTLDPGGEDGDANAIPPVPLVVEGTVENLVVEACILGPIRTDSGGTIERLAVSDSIVQSIDPATPAVALEAGDVHLDRVTVFGGLDVHRLWASEALVTGLVDVTDTQAGCFRFSAAAEGSRLPRPYESHALGDTRAAFTSRRFGHPGYGQLAEAASAEVRLGAESGSEIGAYSALLAPILRRGLEAKVEEYMPFGRIPLFVHET